MIVMKFGGTSVGSASRIKTAADIIRSKSVQKPIVVSSAVSGVTNLLVRLCENPNDREAKEEIIEKHEHILSQLKLDWQLLSKLFVEFDKVLLKKRTPQVCDHILSFGERWAVRILAAHLQEIGVKAQSFDAFDIGMLTTNDAAKAEPLPKAYTLIRKSIASLECIPVVTGYIGKTESGVITTLSRGGSDYTASIIGAAVDAKEIQIWTDVDGVMSTDPRVVSSARRIDSLSFDEASELAYFGAKVLHPKSIIPAMRKNIPVRVLNTHNPQSLGTVIVAKPKKTTRLVKAITCKKNVTLMSITSTRMLHTHGYLAKIFEVFARHKKSVDMITTSEVSVSITLDDPRGAAKIAQELAEIAQVSIEPKRTIVSVVGEGIKKSKTLSGTILTTVGGITNPEMISQGASEINVSVVVDSDHTDSVVRALHRKLVE